MNNTISIRILEKDNNRRGDLFGRLMADLFVALGYEQPRVNIHKSGREVDLATDHRLEPRRAIAECKATRDAVGGDEINKFVGVLDAESVGKVPVTGYFISLAGFRETAVEQERQGRNTKIITLTGTQVVNELIQGRILIQKNRATELAGRCCSSLSELVLEQDCELLAHERGWIWAVYYTQGKARTHFALIHSDGTPLARVLADEIITADQDCSGELYTLMCLNPTPLAGSENNPRIKDALVAYGQYLANECGFIQLDGMPADSDVGSRRLQLENLFVPLNLTLHLKDIPSGPNRVDPGEEDVEETSNRMPVGQVLLHHQRLALLASPGGGKSTLLKRLAIAYADPTRRRQVADNLPDRDWLPLFIRCRELRNLARGSFAELLDALSQREPVRQYSAVFRDHVDRALLAGRVLLLVDGLDEISDSGDRAAFVCTLRAALQAYRGNAVVVTSREAGFRHVAAHLASVCTHATLSPFDREDIRRLSVAWHREVVGDTEKVRTDAEQLASAIVRSDRIKRLAVNPLLLTTLLLVKRWVGSLPTRRVVLYDKAVEVLLMTWNTEGHEPIPEEEALPQLCYVASAMMLSKVERISRPRLALLLKEARDSLPTELGYVKGSVEEFIHRVEDRSSLLMMSGHDVENNRLVEFFEFRHLTFQEFLTARAVVEGWHPGRKEEDTLVDALDVHLGDEKWSEVIPLAAVLGGKETEALIQRLTERVKALDQAEVINHISGLIEETEKEPQSLILALGNCLADEAPARPTTVRAALSELVRAGSALDKAVFTQALVRGRYGADLREEARKAYVTPNANRDETALALLQFVWWQTIESEDAVGFANAAARFVGMLNHPDLIVRCEGSRALMRLCFRVHREERHSERAACVESICNGASVITGMVFSEDTVEQYSASRALVWIGACRVWRPPAEPDLLGRLFFLWQHSPKKDVRESAAWALSTLPLTERDDGRRCATIPKVDFALLEQYPTENDLQLTESIAALVVTWYLRTLTDAQIIARVHAMAGKKDVRIDKRTSGQTLRELLERFGEKLKERT